jgi:pSer/pThr/pTyr-binding forkhead associated (FHA) protein
MTDTPDGPRIGYTPRTPFGGAGAQKPDPAASESAEERTQAAWTAGRRARYYVVFGNTSRIEVVEGDGLLLGRHVGFPALDDSLTVSKPHARVRLKDGEFLVADVGPHGEGSLNGTFIAGERLAWDEPARRVTPGTPIVLGETQVMLVRIDE